MDLSDCSRLLYHWAIPPDLRNCLVSCKQLFSSRIEPARQNAQPTRLQLHRPQKVLLLSFKKHFVYQNLLCEESKKRLLRLREKNAFPNGNVACNLILWSCSKAFFLFLWRRQFQLDWTLFGRFDSTHFYGRDSSLSLIRTHTYYLLFYISAILSWLPCRHSIRPTTKNRLDRRVDTFFSVQLHMEDRWLLKKITWH